MKAGTRWLLVAALLACACENKDKAPESKPAPEPVASAPAAPPPPAAPPQVDLSKAEAPTEADFEADAEQSISAKNLDQELDKLEKEIGDTR